MSGMGADRVVSLRVESPAIEHWWIDVMTRDIEPIPKPATAGTGGMSMRIRMERRSIISPLRRGRSSARYVMV